MSQNSYLVKSFAVILVPNKYVTPFCNVKMLIIYKTAPCFRFANQVLLAFNTAMAFGTLAF